VEGKVPYPVEKLRELVDLQTLPNKLRPEKRPNGGHESPHLPPVGDRVAGNETGGSTGIRLKKEKKDSHTGPIGGLAGLKRKAAHWVPPIDRSSDTLGW